jgi:hypothetical protein
MRAVIPEVRRVLKPSGSAVFILQPNSERVGRMRTWLWDFLAWVGKEWGIVQDAYWWNYAALPGGGCAPRGRGLLRSSVKMCVWLGGPDCYRDQGGVLWGESERTAGDRLGRRWARGESPSGNGCNRPQAAHVAAERGGATPFNLMPCPNENNARAGHGAPTPLMLCSWWLRYACPPGGSVLDPFAGSGTTGVAALRQGASFSGVEVVPEYVETARKRLDAERAKTPLFAGLPA